MKRAQLRSSRMTSGMYPYNTLKEFVKSGARSASVPVLENVLRVHDDISLFLQRPVLRCQKLLKGL